MARPSASPSAPKKEPGRLRQMVDVFKMTRRMDPSSLWYMILAFILPVLAGVALAVFLSPDNIIGLILYIVAGVLGGVLLFLIVLGRKAERAAYTNIAGQPGAVGAVLKNGLRRGWTGSEMPVNVSPKTQDAVYRAVGRGGHRAHRRGPAQPHAADARGRAPRRSPGSCPTSRSPSSTSAPTPSPRRCTSCPARCAR